MIAPPWFRTKDTIRPADDARQHAHAWGSSLDEQDRVGHSVAQDRYWHCVRGLFLVVEFGRPPEAILASIILCLVMSNGYVARRLPVEAPDEKSAIEEAMKTFHVTSARRFKLMVTKVKE